MFTFGAFVLLVVLAFLVNRRQAKHRPEYGHLDEPNAQLLLHIRQDMQLVAVLLGGVIIMLGVVADRVG